MHVTKRCYRSGSATFSTIHGYTKICFDPIGIGKQETIHKHTQVKNNIIAMQHAASCQLPCVRFWPKTFLAKCANSHSATTSVIKTIFYACFERESICPATNNGPHWSSQRRGTITERTHKPNFEKMKSWHIFDCGVFRRARFFRRTQRLTCILTVEEHRHRRLSSHQQRMRHVCKSFPNAWE